MGSSGLEVFKSEVFKLVEDGAVALAGFNFALGVVATAGFASSVGAVWA
jgi:hypothetical protein